MIKKKLDPVIGAAFKKALMTGNQSVRGKCPDDNTVVSYLENRLSLTDRSQCEDHFSSCLHCQQLLGISLKLSAAGEAADKGERVSWPVRMLSFRYGLPLTSAALLVLTVGAGILVFVERKNPGKDSTGKQVAELQSPSAPEPHSPADTPSVDRSTRHLTDRVREKPKRSTEKTPGARSADQIVSTEKKVIVGPHIGLSSAPVPTAKSELEESRAKDARSGSVAGIQKGAGASAGIAGGRQGYELQTSTLEPPEKVLIAFSQQFRLQQQAVNFKPGKVGKTRSQSTQSMPPPENAQAQQEPKGQIRQGQSERRTSDNSNLLFLSAPQSRQAGERTFDLFAGYWIDRECIEHPDAELIEVSVGDARFQEIRQAFPGIVELSSSGTPVLVYWQMKNFVIQPAKKE